MIRRSPCSVALTGSWSFVVWWRRRDACYGRGGRLLIEHGELQEGPFVSCSTVSPMCAPGRT